MLYLHYLCLFTYSGIQHIFCLYFVWSVFVLCLVLCVTNAASVSGLPLWFSLPFIGNSSNGFRCRKGFCFGFLRLVYHMLPVSLDYPFLIAPSIFSNLYLPHNVVSSTPHHDPHGIKYIYECKCEYQSCIQ